MEAIVKIDHEVSGSGIYTFVTVLKQEGFNYMDFVRFRAVEVKSVNMPELYIDCDRVTLYLLGRNKEYKIGDRVPCGFTSNEHIKMYIRALDKLLQELRPFTIDLTIHNKTAFDVNEMIPSEITILGNNIEIKWFNNYEVGVAKFKSTPGINAVKINAEIIETPDPYKPSSLEFKDGKILFTKRNTGNFLIYNVEKWLVTKSTLYLTDFTIHFVIEKGG